ncbi:MAG: MFS transporter [Salinibacterium sp.]|nr:MAG: MFS transporter [Salinibacterium sp.]
MSSRRLPAISAWRFVIVSGTVSLLADFVYEGARSVTGPVLAFFGATGLIVGVVTGIGEAASLLLRLVSGPLADRTQRFWAWTIAGYALTVISVPTLGYAGVLWVACGLVILERVGKAVRAPAKDALLSYATAATGRGKGFAVHEAIDQFGAVIGPLVVAAMLALTGNDYGPSLAVLALPGVIAMGLLFWQRAKVPNPVDYEVAPKPHESITLHLEPLHLPRAFWTYAAFTSTTMVGFATFGLISFHIVEAKLLPIAVVPLLYAGVMIVDALAALATGWAYDRFGPRVLVALPIVAASIPVLAFQNGVAAVVMGSLLWGMALGIQESTLRATVADLIEPQRRSTAYGVFAAVVGVATAGGGALAGALYDVSVPLLVGITVAVQVLAVLILLVFTRAIAHSVNTE